MRNDVRERNGGRTLSSGFIAVVSSSSALSSVCLFSGLLRRIGSSVERGKALIPGTRRGRGRGTRGLMTRIGSAPTNELACQHLDPQIRRSGVAMAMAIAREFARCGKKAKGPGLWMRYCFTREKMLGWDCIEAADEWGSDTAFRSCTSIIF
jgi:hypothetical protein